MLIHIVPKLFEPPFAVTSEIMDVSIPECGLVLAGGKDVIARRPFPNKRYLVACRKTGQKAMGGILIEVNGSLQTYTVITRWLVNGEVITHFVEHDVLDQEFDTVSDNMILWYARYGTTWQMRWPECYTEAPVARQPAMDVLTSLRNGLTRPEEVLDVVDEENQRVILRIEPFKLHTIERERLLNETERSNYRIPGIKDAFNAKPVVMPDMTIALNNDITANLLLVPMPAKDAKGSYPKFVGKNASLMPDAYLSFSRNGEILAAKVPWGVVINDRDFYSISQEISLSEDDLYEIDTKGWELMGQFGMFPTELVLKVSCGTEVG